MTCCKGKDSDIELYHMDGCRGVCTCHDCILEKNRSSVSLKSAADVVAHLREHLRHTHLIPQRILDGWCIAAKDDALLHFGLELGRLQHQHSQREVAFALEWEKECQAKLSINDGRGTLQCLMWDDKSKQYVFEITQRDATIVATVIQWLGTNCGFAFLDAALRRCGYQIVRLPEAAR